MEDLIYAKYYSANLRSQGTPDQLNREEVFLDQRALLSTAFFPLFVILEFKQDLDRIARSFYWYINS